MADVISCFMLRRFKKPIMRSQSSTTALYYRLSLCNFAMIAFFSAIPTTEILAQSSQHQQIAAFFVESFSFTVDFKSRGATANLDTAGKYFNGSGDITIEDVISSGLETAKYLTYGASYAVHAEPCSLILTSKTPEQELVREWDGSLSPNQQTAEKIVFDLYELAESEAETGSTEPSRIKLETLPVSLKFQSTDSVHSVRLPIWAQFSKEIDGTWMSTNDKEGLLEFLVDANQYSSDDVVALLKLIITACPYTAADETQSALDEASTAYGPMLVSQINSCWIIPLIDGDRESMPSPKIRVLIGANGELLEQPALTNQSQHPEFGVLAASAIKAVEECAPFQIPGEFADKFVNGAEFSVNFAVPKF